MAIIKKKTSKVNYNPPVIENYLTAIKPLPECTSVFGGINFGLIDTTPKPETAIVIGSGMSLKNFNFNRLTGKDFYIITLNDTGRVVPWADAWITIDPWGLHGPQIPMENFKGKIYAGVSENYNTRECKIVGYTHEVPDKRIVFVRRLFRTNAPTQEREQSYYYRLSEDPSCVATGNSGYAAFNLAYLLKPKNIVLLGIDGGRGYFFTNQKSNRPLHGLNALFTSSLDQINGAGINVINGSLDSEVTCFPRYDIDTALGMVE
jgi:hypothetical protein